MTTRLWYSAAALLLTQVVAVRGADRDAFGDPLPEGARARLGTIRHGPVDTYHSTHLLAPWFNTLLVGGTSAVRLHGVATGKVTELAAADFARRGARIGAVSANGKRALYVGSMLSTVVDVATGKDVGSVWGPDPGRLVTVSFSEDGGLLAYGVPPPRAPGRNAPSAEVVVWNVDKEEAAARFWVLQAENVSAVLAPNGKVVATFSWPGGSAVPKEDKDVQPHQVVQLWDVETGKELAALTATRADFVMHGCAAFSRDARTLATAAGDGAIVLWSVPEGKIKKRLLGRRTQGVKLAFAPDGKTLAAMDQYGAVERWTLQEGKALPLTEFPLRPSPTGAVRSSEVPFTPLGLAFATDERVVAWGALFDRTVVWEVPGGKWGVQNPPHTPGKPEGIAPGGKLLTPVAQHLAEIRAVWFAPNSRDVITAGRDRRIVRWNPADSKSTVLGMIDDPSGWGPERATLVALGGKRGLSGTVVFDPQTGAESFRVPGTTVFTAPDLVHAFAVTEPRNPRNEIPPGTVWNLDSRKSVARMELPASTGKFRAPREIAAAFSPDGSRLVTAVQVLTADPGRKTALIVTGWDVKTGKKLGEFAEPETRDTTELAAARNNSGAVLATSDGRLWVADYEKGGRGETIDEAPRDTKFTRPTFSADGKLLAVGARTDDPDTFAVRIYSWPGGKLLHTFAGHRGPITALAFSPDGKTLASGSADTAVLLWDLTKIEQPK
jgi:WD40 repeat protein